MTEIASTGNIVEIALSSYGDTVANPPKQMIISKTASAQKAPKHS
jgi:hypothetical protein